MVTAVEGDTNFSLEEFTLHGLFVLLMHLVFAGYHNIAENVTKMEEDNNNTYIRAYQYLTN